jgi:hypothetical protein
MNMRRKPSSQGGSNYNNQRNNRPRYQSGGGGGGDHRNNGGGSNRPRKNYGAMREKYLANARDALASGDRVLAENYYQHADHCYRMMVEEGSQQRPQQPQQAQPQGSEESQDNAGQENRQEDGVSGNISVLPAFLTVNIEQPDAPAQQPPAPQNWEERDA